MYELTEDSMRANMCFWFAGRLFGTWVQLIAVFSSIIGIFIITFTLDDPATVGQSLSYYILIADFI